MYVYLANYKVLGGSLSGRPIGQDIYFFGELTKTKQPLINFIYDPEKGKMFHPDLCWDFLFSTVKLHVTHRQKDTLNMLMRLPIQCEELQEPWASL